MGGITIRQGQAQRDPRPVVGLENAIVVEISYDKAKELILKYEWLGNMGTTERSFGLILDGELAGVVCFGKTGGTDTAKSVCGEEWAQYVVTLCRGACLSFCLSTRGVVPHQRGLQADGEQCQNDEERESVSTRVYICRLFGHGRRGDWNCLSSLQLVELRKNFWHDDVP
jgi:hypothetical protein